MLSYSVGRVDQPQPSSPRLAAVWTDHVQQLQNQVPRGTGFGPERCNTYHQPRRKGNYHTTKSVNYHTSNGVKQAISTTEEMKHNLRFEGDLMNHGKK